MEILVPQTPLGQSLAALLMIMGYGIIAVPTGIVTAELTQANIQLQKHNYLSLVYEGRPCYRCRLLSVFVEIKL